MPIPQTAPNIGPKNHNLSNWQHDPIEKMWNDETYSPALPGPLSTPIFIL